MNIAGKNVTQWMFSTADQIAFLEQWKSCHEYGLSTRQFCDALIDNGTDATKAIGTLGKDAPARGLTFTGILKGWLPDMVIAAIDVASHEGDTRAGLIAAIDQLQGGQGVIGRIARCLAVPYAISLLVGGLGVFISGKILAATRGGVGIGTDVLDTVSLFGLPVAIGCVVLLFGLSLVLPRWTGSQRRAVNHWPIFNLYKNASASLLLGTLGNLLSCGMKLDDALQAVEKNSPPFLRDHVTQMRAQGVGQSNVGITLDTGLLIPFELSTLKVLGGHAQYSTLLSQCARAHKKVVDTRLARMNAFLPKVGMLIAISLLGGLIGSAVSQLLSTIQ